MNINLKIEIIKILLIEFSLSSDKKELKKDETDEKDTASEPADDESASSGK